ncbi:YdcH family protein [Pseudopelagicola sp. nBUS_19]|uniref:YdcH family protein n=1 Tax=unclassified Pseudopelagicola TaxID=2649563 RepID=UPI003EBFA7C8
MANTPHELAEEFPEFVDKMSNLKTRDKHFERMFNEYHEMNRKVHRAETNIQPRWELAEVDLRKRRAALKDEIYAYLKSS